MTYNRIDTNNILNAVFGGSSLTGRIDTNSIINLIYDPTSEALNCNIVNLSGCTLSEVLGGSNINIDNTDPNKPIVNVDESPSFNSLALSGNCVVDGDLTVLGTYYVVHAEEINVSDNTVIQKYQYPGSVTITDFTSYTAQDEFPNIYNPNPTTFERCLQFADTISFTADIIADTIDGVNYDFVYRITGNIDSATTAGSIYWEAEVLQGDPEDRYNSGYWAFVKVDLFIEGALVDGVETENIKLDGNLITESSTKFAGKVAEAGDIAIFITIGTPTIAVEGDFTNSGYEYLVDNRGVSPAIVYITETTLVPANIIFGTPEYTYFTVSDVTTGAKAVIIAEGAGTIQYGFTPTKNIVLGEQEIEGFSNAVYADYARIKNSVITPIVSATTISATTLFSGSTDLSTIFAPAGTLGDITRVQGGTNISTGGTANEPTVSLAANISVNDITASGNTSLSAVTVNDLVAKDGIYITDSDFNKDKNGTWRVVITNGDLVFSKRVADAWVVSTTLTTN